MDAQVVPVRFLEQGCFADGAVRWPTEVFAHTGRRCGCHDQNLYCAVAEEQRCFAHGMWFADSKEMAGPQEQETCLCSRDGEWSCRFECPVPQLSVIRFSVASTTIANNDIVRLRAVSERQARSGEPTVVRLRGYSASIPKTDAQLTPQRLAAVTAQLVSFGVPRTSIEVIDRGAREIEPILPFADCNRQELLRGPAIQVLLSSNKQSEPQ